MEPIVVQTGKSLPSDKDRNKILNSMRFFKASYEGGSAYKDSLDDNNEPVLISHENESDEGYKRRKRSATYLNYCKPIVQKFNNLVFSSPIIRDQSVGMWQDFVDDCDLMGTDLASFVRKAVKNAQIDGERYCIFESTKSENVLTVAQAMLENSRPFLIDVDPRNILARRVGGNNRILQILIKVDKKEARLYDKNFIQVCWLNDSGIVSQIDILPNPYRMVPVVLFAANDDVSSQLVDIAQVCKALFNLDALLSEEQARQVFTQWFASGLDVSSPDPRVTEVQNKPLEPVVVGGRKLIATANKDVTFTRLSGDTSQSQALQANMIAKIEEIYRLSGMRDPQVQEASGRALKILFDEALMQARMLSSNAEHSENDIIDLFMSATGQSLQYSVYPPTFLSEDQATDLDNVIKALQSELPPTLQSAFVEKFMSQHFADLPEELKAQIKRELEVILGNLPEPDKNAPPDEEVIQQDQNQEDQSINV